MTSKRRKKILLAIALLAVLALALGLWVQKRQAEPAPSPEVGTKARSVKPALTVTLTSPVPATLTTSITANGSVAAWQEASIGSEAQGLRLEQVNVNVGDRVAKGQLLASFASETVLAQLQQTGAAISEARAILAEASADAQRARGLQGTGALSAQQISQYLTAERTAQARLELQQAAEKLQQLRLEQARVFAPDSGIISARNATLGAVVPAGQELFRLIRQGRLEWRAEVAEADLARLKPGMPVSVAIAGGAPITGRARVVAPTVDPATRNGLVYVDLPSQATVRAGMFARGSFELGQSQGLTLPQSTA